MNCQKSCPYIEKCSQRIATQEKRLGNRAVSEAENTDFLAGLDIESEDFEEAPEEIVSEAEYLFGVVRASNQELAAFYPQFAESAKSAIQLEKDRIASAKKYCVEGPKIKRKLFGILGRRVVRCSSSDYEASRSGALAEISD